MKGQKFTVKKIIKPFFYYCDEIGISFINPFVPYATFFYHQEISENLKAFQCFLGWRKDALGTSGLISNINGKITCINGLNIFAIRPKKI